MLLKAAVATDIFVSDSATKGAVGGSDTETKSESESETERREEQRSETENRHTKRRQWKIETEW